MAGNALPAVVTHEGHVDNAAVEAVDLVLLGLFLAERLETLAHALICFAASTGCTTRYVSTHILVVLFFERSSLAGVD